MVVVLSTCDDDGSCAATILGEEDELQELFPVDSSILLVKVSVSTGEPCGKS